MKLNLFEYIQYDTNKFLTKWKTEGKPYENQIGSDGSKFTSWLEQYDPSPRNKYVNWMIISYLKNNIKRLEDIPSRIGPALKIYMGLANKNKLKPEHKDINKISDIEDIIDEYKEIDVTSKSEIKDKYLKSGEAELIYDDPEWKIIVPKTEEASCHYGINTRWCTAATEAENMFDEYNKKGPLYIILQKSTNTRWQFQFETNQFMDEKDRGINIFDFFKSHKKIFGIFKNLGYVDYKPNQWKIGNMYYNDDEILHKEDGPAASYPDGRLRWYKDGKLHREDGPAVIYPNGIQEWYKDGKYHREDGPAIIYSDGRQYWYKYDKLHREDGPAIIRPDGSQFWYKDGKPHREDGPAYISPNKYQKWYKDGKLHREDGPAVIDPDGRQYWYLNGKEYSEEEWKEEVSKLKEDISINRLKILAGIK